MSGHEERDWTAGHGGEGAKGRLGGEKQTDTETEAGGV